MKKPPANSPRRQVRRSTYRHGDLRRTLLTAAIALAQESGPEAVVLREATRRAGVAPNAAYRHFKSHADLVIAVRAAALEAMAAAMQKRLAALGAPREELADARAALRAVGAAYIHFARHETGLFRTAFVVPFERVREPEPGTAGDLRGNPFLLLSTVLDRLARCQGLKPAQRPGAEYLAWSAVHGMAMLAIDGPLRELKSTPFEALGARLLAMVERGLAPP